MSGNFAIKGGGVVRLMANAILNFHFDFLSPSLKSATKIYFSAVCYLPFSIVLQVGPRCRGLQGGEGWFGTIIFCYVQPPPLPNSWLLAIICWTAENGQYNNLLFIISIQSKCTSSILLNGRTIFSTCAFLLQNCPVVFVIHVTKPFKEIAEQVPQILVVRLIGEAKTLAILQVQDELNR